LWVEKLPMDALRVEEKWIDTGPGRIYAKRWHAGIERGGSETPIVLFHDSLGCVALWRDFPERLAHATGRDIIAYDRLGFGQSDPHPGRLERGFVRDEAHLAFRYLREALDIGRFVALGHSVGGGMAVACAATYPETCCALIAESAQAFVERRTIEGILAAKKAFAQPGQVERLARYHGDKAEWVLSAWIDTWTSAEFAGWNLDESLRRVSCPLLIIHGDQDEYGSLLHPERIASFAQGMASLRILHGCGHVPHREEGEQVIDMVTRWLQTVC
jgi:pimeloyl-ACP methyl ester carboxylesterase